MIQKTLKIKNSHEKKLFLQPCDYLHQEHFPEWNATLEIPQLQSILPQLETKQVVGGVQAMGNQVRVY